MKCRNGNLASGAARLLLTSLVLFACFTLFTESAQVQQPAPTPISVTDTEPAGEPQKVELEGGKYKLVYKNKAGQVVLEEEYAVGVLVRQKHVITIYPSGQEAKVLIKYFGIPVTGLPMETRRETIQYDRFGNPKERLTVEPHRMLWRVRRERWNRETESWEAAPENQRWNPTTGRWEEVPTNQRFNPESGEWENVTSSATPQKTSANPEYRATNTVAGGLNTATLTTPQGTINVNLPSDMAPGDTLSGTIIAEPQGKDEKERAANQGELSGYVVEMEKQQASSTSRILKLAIPAAISTTHLILRDKQGKEVARIEVPVVRQPPPVAEFDLPTMGQQGRPVEVSGRFDGEFSTTNLKVGGEDLEVLAESPRKVVARNTSNKTGPTELAIEEQGRTARGEFRSLGIRLSAPKLNLLRGEKTTLTVTVLGLEGIKEPVPLVLENRSAGVISMGDGNFERITISPSQVQEGTYTTERQLTSIQRGAFTITATVITSDCGRDQPQTSTNVTGGTQTGGGTPGYNICGSGCKKPAREQGSGRIRCNQQKACQDRGTNCKCHMFRRPINTTQDYEHVENPGVYVDEAAGFDYVCKCVN